MKRVSRRLASTTQNTSNWNSRKGINQLQRQIGEMPRTGMPSIGHTTSSTLVTTTKNQVARMARSSRAEKVPHSQCSRQKREIEMIGRSSLSSGGMTARVRWLIWAISLDDSGKITLNNQCPAWFSHLR
ncbi:hypothetical protein D3C81_1402030 [compost metagenome]